MEYLIFLTAVLTPDVTLTILMKNMQKCGKAIFITMKVFGNILLALLIVDSSLSH